MELSGYVLETLREDRVFALYRAREPGSLVSILVRAPLRGQQTPASLERLEHEYALAGELDPAWAALPLALARQDGHRVLVLEDAGGDPLERNLGQPLEPGYFLRLAIAAAGALGQVHRRGLIHKDIKPANLLVDAAGNVRLTGFGIASRLPRERQTPAPLEVIAGTFAYMAPEQTGRMNRSIDARSDLYSLGVTLYEMATGTLPSPPPTPWSGSIVTSPASRCLRISGSAAFRRRSRASS
jgi:Serine/threonine protein kinase